MDALYAKEDFSDADGIKAGELSVIYDEMGGWNAESDAKPCFLTWESKTKCTGK